MSENTTLSPKERIKAELVGEMSKINWRELERFYAKGQVVLVADNLDLIDAAVAVVEDNKDLVEQWMGSCELSRVDNQTAQAWHDRQTEVWAVVLAPWVLVQAHKPSE